MNDHPVTPRGSNPRNARADSACAVELNVDEANAARIYDYNLGGKDNFAADREVAAAMNAVLPELPIMARANRAFLPDPVLLQGLGKVAVSRR